MNWPSFFIGLVVVFFSAMAFSLNIFALANGGGFVNMAGIAFACVGWVAGVYVTLNA